MAWVKGPNQRVAHVPDRVARSLVGDGKRGYAWAHEPKPPVQEESNPPAPRKRAARKPK